METENNNKPLQTKIDRCKRVSAWWVNTWRPAKKRKKKKEKGVSHGVSHRFPPATTHHPLKPVSGWAPRVVYIAPVGPLAKQYRLWSRYLCTPRADRCLCTNRTGACFFFLFWILFFFFRWKRILFPWTGEGAAACRMRMVREQVCVLVCENWAKKDKWRSKDNSKNGDLRGKSVCVTIRARVCAELFALYSWRKRGLCANRKDYQKVMKYHLGSSDCHC